MPKVRGRICEGTGHAGHVGTEIMRARSHVAGLGLVRGTLNVEPTEQTSLTSIERMLASVPHTESPEQPHREKGQLRMWKATLRNEADSEEQPCVVVRLDGSATRYMEVMSHIHFGNDLGLSTGDLVSVTIMPPDRSGCCWAPEVAGEGK